MFDSDLQADKNILTYIGEEFTLFIQNAGWLEYSLLALQLAVALYLIVAIPEILSRFGGENWK